MKILLTFLLLLPLSALSAETKIIRWDYPVSGTPLGYHLWTKVGTNAVTSTLLTASTLITSVVISQTGVLYQFWITAFDATMETPPSNVLEIILPTPIAVLVSPGNVRFYTNTTIRVTEVDKFP